jgi:hypothetical protein
VSRAGSKLGLARPTAGVGLLPAGFRVFCYFFTLICCSCSHFDFLQFS